MRNSKNATNANHENGPESRKLLKVPTTPTVTPTMPSRGLDEVFRDLPITDDTSCGIWCCRGPNLQRLANKKAYVFLYGVLGCIFSASYAYFNGTITTLEKRFKIPSKTTGEFPVDILNDSYEKRSHSIFLRFLRVFSIVLPEGK